MFDLEKIRQGAIAAIASLILTVTMVGAAVGPAHAVAAPANMSAAPAVSARA
jgi:hypothetical protein